jgi:hypothetical protein
LSKKIAFIGIPTFLYLNENTYIACLGVKRSLVALAFEGVIYLNYKYVSSVIFLILVWV